MTPLTCPKSYRRRIGWSDGDITGGPAQGWMAEVGDTLIGVFQDYDAAERNARFAPDRCVLPETYFCGEPNQ